MTIDRHDDDDGPATAVAADAIVANEISVPAGKRESPEAKEPRIPEDRGAYHTQYRETVDAEYRAAARERWHAAKPKFETECREYARQRPTPPDSSPALDQATITKVRYGCDRIGETEEKVVTPAMLRIEAADPERQLVGLEHRRKGQDRIMEKVARQMESQADLTPEEALASVKDAIRYTFQYAEERYTEGVNADVNRLKAAGFELVDLRNSWEREEYKGINSRWLAPENGQLFEVQFHTQISFEAKQLTHNAYERLRIQATAKAERDELKDFQRRVSTCVPVPHGASHYPDHP